MSSNSVSSEATSPTAVRRVLGHVWQSNLLRIALLGVVLVVLGALVIDGVFAGMFGIWGVSAMLVGFGGYLVYKLSYEP
ncbi:MULTISPECIES: hypothetical protein [Halomicrobium]|uniref:hypothetical protein n=1 Tax=Halomicrobium TaxID=203135 RepID=UPI0012A7D92D|nr:MULTISPECIES: hypothetical protein [Halomicrobium]MBO4248594.1 hypothetical protein [Halomicrobium sp. IBSBa]QGA82221.1 hypothetical protein LC1Hm_1164 [Halomicrobium sp. LC1Hm]